MKFPFQEAPLQGPKVRCLEESCEEDVTLELSSGKSFPEAHSGACGAAVTQKALSLTVSTTT